MAQAPARFCAGGCNTIVRGGTRCERCDTRLQLVRQQLARARDRDSVRASTASRGYGAAWQRRRRWQLRIYRWCEKCLDARKKVRAMDVDHRVPKARGGSDDPSNLMSLCHAHHSAKTASRDGGFGNPRRS